MGISIKFGLRIGTSNESKNGITFKNVSLLSLKNWNLIEGVSRNIFAIYLFLKSAFFISSFVTGTNSILRPATSAATSTFLALLLP